MVTIASLWLPILLSAVAVFIVSSIIHTALGYHNTDFKVLPEEDKVMAALRPFDIPPGDYFVPFSTDPKVRKSGEFKDKLNKGPVAVMTVFPNGEMSMGTSLILWFAYSVVISIFAAYIAAHALEPGAAYLDVFRFVGSSAFLGYSLALVQNSIWYKRNWSATGKSVFDGLIYALFTAGVFGWLWPAAA